MEGSDKSKNIKKQKRNWNDLGGLPYDKIPAFKTALDFYKECQYRFRNVPSDAKPTAREVKAKILRTMTLIAHARLNIRVQQSLQEALFLSMEAQIVLRVLVETKSISIKDFANISKLSDNLVRQMVGWRTSEFNKNM